MKTTHVCPKCRSRDLYHSPCVMDRGEGNEALCLAVKRADPISAQEIGQFEVFVCRGCGFAELYVINPRELEDE